MKKLIIILVALFLNSCTFVTLKTGDIELKYSSWGDKNLDELYIESDEFCAYVEKAVSTEIDINTLSSTVASAVVEAIK